MSDGDGVAVTASARFGSGLNKYSASTDNWFQRTGWNAFADTMETLVAIATQGTFATRPAASASQPRRFYFATDQNLLYYDTGGTWVTVGPVGGITPSGPAQGGSAGTSRTAAAADHQHPGAYGSWRDSSVVNVAGGTWNRCDITSSSTEVIASNTPAITIDTGSPLLNTPGLYQVSAWARFVGAIGNGGWRALGISTDLTTDPDLAAMTWSADAGVAGTHVFRVSADIRVTVSPVRASLRATTTASGATVTSRGITVRFVG